MGWFTDKKIKNGQDFPRYVTYETGNFKGDWWKSDEENTEIFIMDHPIKKEDIPNIEEYIKRTKGTGWAKVKKLH